MTTENVPASDTGKVFRLIYRSRSRIVPDRRKVALGELFSDARSNNKKQGITGALLISGNWFAQTLEGEESLVRDLFEKIEKDGRHEHVTVLQTEDAVDRVFSRWAMARVSEDGEPDIPLIAHRDGISPAAGHKITPEQESVLGFMRTSAQAS